MSDVQDVNSSNLDDGNEALKDTRSEIENNVESAKDNLGSAVESAKENASNVVDSAKENLGNAAESAKDNLGNAVESAKETASNVVDSAKEKLQNMPSVDEAVEKVKDKLPDVTPVPPSLHQQATASELKSRLQWGEPGLTILDARDRSAFDECHIKGAMLASLEEFEAGNKFNMEPKRDIYIYGASDEETARAASILRQSGFLKVAELQGGLTDWTAIGGATEGLATQGHSPAASERNVVSRLQEFSKQKSEEKGMRR